MKIGIISVLLSGVLLVSAQVKQVEKPLPLDGNYSGGGWRDVPEQADFFLVKSTGKTKPVGRTGFKIAADADHLYVSILCHENKMEKLRKSDNPSTMWVSDTAEIFFCPTGQPDEFYQFSISAGKSRYTMFYAEEGVIRPDPYLPFWESKVFYGKDYWLVQLRIPFSAFYMTRNARWSSEWLVNVARCRKPVSELSSWSPLKGHSFLESRSFRKFRGFPKRNPTQDVLIGKVKPEILNYAGGIYSGPLHLFIEANPAAAGKYELTVEEPGGKRSTHEISLKGGQNLAVLPKVEYLKKKQGKTDLRITLKAAGSGVDFGRDYPVDIVYQPLRIILNSPGYRGNFYPGQDHSAIRGELKLSLSPEQKKTAKVNLSISGGGLAEQTLSFEANRETIPFRFDSSKLAEGGKAQLTAKITNGGKEIASFSCHIRRLKKNAGSMVWIENGVLVKNGKPWYPRDIYARGYLGGKAFAERCKADDLAESRFRAVSVEPRILIRGIEGTEATKDVKPCPALLEKIRKIVERWRNDPELDMYYICDEPEYRNISPVYLKHIYDFVSELDPYHPILSCSTDPGKYLDCMDVISPHPYINPIISGGKRLYQRPMHQVRNTLRNVAKSNRQDKVRGFTGCFFSCKYMNLQADYPNWEELECMSWCAIAEGSRFQYPYAYHDLGDRPQIYEAYRYFNQSIKALEKQLLSNRKYPVKTVDPENLISAMLAEGDGVTLLIVVNLKNGPLDTVISAEHLKKFQSLLEFRGKGSRKIVNGELKLSLKPYECVVLISKKLDAELKTRDQVLKEIAAADKARAARGNLLFEKGASFEVDSSNPGTALQSTLQERNRLFDGTIDMLGWRSKPWSKNNWYELNFRKNPPKFSKIRIHGFNMGDPSVKIWKFGEWKNLTPKKVTKAKYSVLLDFGEELKSVKVRITFPVKVTKVPIELYEIELLK